MNVRCQRFSSSTQAFCAPLCWEWERRLSASTSDSNNDLFLLLLLPLDKLLPRTDWAVFDPPTTPNTKIYTMAISEPDATEDEGAWKDPFKQVYPEMEMQPSTATQDLLGGKDSSDGRQVGHSRQHSAFEPNIGSTRGLTPGLQGDYGRRAEELYHGAHGAKLWNPSGRHRSTLSNTTVEDISRNANLSAPNTRKQSPSASVCTFFDRFRGGTSSQPSDGGGSATQTPGDTSTRRLRGDQWWAKTSNTKPSLP